MRQGTERQLFDNGKMTATVCALWVQSTVISGAGQKSCSVQMIVNIGAPGLNMVVTSDALAGLRQCSLPPSHFTPRHLVSSPLHDRRLRPASKNTWPINYSVPLVSRQSLTECARV